MSQHFEALEADFLREYKIDLRDATSGRNRIGLRRLMVLIKGLPPHSALTRSSTSGQEWTNVEELLATIIEVIDQGNSLFYQSKAKKGSAKWRPVKIARPGRQTSSKQPRRAAPYVRRSEKPELADKRTQARFFQEHGKVIVVKDEDTAGGAN